MLRTLSCALLLVACGGEPSGPAEQVDGDEVVLRCNADLAPLRVRVPAEAVVTAYLCDEQARRCTTVDHVLDGDVVEVRCSSSPGRPRKIRWVAPVR